MLPIEQKSDDAGVAEAGTHFRRHRLQFAFTGRDAKESLPTADPDAPVRRLGKGVDISTQGLSTRLTEANDFGCTRLHAKDTILRAHPQGAVGTCQQAPRQAPGMLQSTQLPVATAELIERGISSQPNRAIASLSHRLDARARRWLECQSGRLGFP
ncbi:MAG: hypothetical protein KBE22_05580 [Candidatus Accumulibacter sp.]|nr:hypothetical protein [Accumulibacter sp.]